ncbi:MAG: DNA-binding protein WhiA [Clostridiales bacterium]|nr:DNA-binding protein WhiA [Clostridiales bacterium]
MSFSSETKNELARVEPEKKCDQLAEIAGFLRVSGSLRLTGRGKFTIVIATDNPAIARHYKRLIREYFQIDAKLEVGGAEALKKGHTYMLTISPEDRSESILRETGILLVREGNNFISDGIYEELIRKKCCKRAYMRGMFMGTGTISDPEKSYHLEFVCESRTLANDLKKMINSFVDLSVKVVQRRNRWVVYMKNSQYISDMLALMGAHAQMLAFENVRVQKSVYNQTTRIMNCDNANTDRTLDASEKQIRAIRILEETGQLSVLTDKLRELARLRVENPEASLTQLGEMMEPKLGKSGVNNRMKRILSMAEKVTGGK